VTENTKPDRFRIDDLLVETGTRKVFRGDEPIELSRLSFDLLRALIDAAPNVATTDELVEAVWGGTVVSDETLTQRIKVLRDSLNHGDDKHRYIETVRAVGYRLRPEVVVEPPTPEVAAAERLPMRHRGKWAVAAALALTMVFGAAFFRAAQPRVDAPTARSIAVLPFVALSDGADDGYFADGLTEEILNALTQVPELLVTARTSAFVFKGRDLPATEIAARLGVAHLVEGTVRRAGDRLRVTAQLVRAADGFQIWSDSFDRELTDNISVQIEIAERITAALDVLLDDARKTQMRSAGIRDPEAFIAYQKGVQLLNAAHGSREMLNLLSEANGYFEAALERAPDFSDAHLQHADYFSHLIFRITAGRAPEGFSSSDIHDLQAALVDDYDAAVRYAPSDTRRVNAELDRALITGDWRDLDTRIDGVLAEPGCQLPVWFDVVALPYDRIEQTIATFRRAVECNPLDFSARLYEFRLAMWRGDFEEALRASTVGAETTGNPALGIARIKSLIALGRFEEAKTAIDRDATDEPHYVQHLLAAAKGDSDEAESLRRSYAEALGKSDHDSIHQYAVIGDRRNANRLAAAIDGRPYGHMALANAILTCFCGAPFDLEATPNFARRIRDAGLAWPPASPVAWPLKNW
jgi:TolB-like protein/DNA-binding winged helix-turn-helix (wHTH) protein